MILMNQDEKSLEFSNIMIAKIDEMKQRMYAEKTNI